MSAAASAGPQAARKPALGKAASTELVRHLDDANIWWRITAQRGYAVYALMVTDIVRGGTELLVAGDPTPVERSMGVRERDGVLDLPGVMSRKKQVAPMLLAAL